MPLGRPAKPGETPTRKGIPIVRPAGSPPAAPSRPRPGVQKGKPAPTRNK